MLLRRYGVVFRELLARESILPPWREVHASHSGASKIAARCAAADSSAISLASSSRCLWPSSLSARMRQAPSLDERVTVSAADPLNLVGIIVPGERVPANSGASVTYQDGVAVTEPRIPAAIALSLAR